MPISSAPSGSTPLPSAVITGGSAGLGLVIAREFLDAGYHVFIVGRSQQRLDEAKNALGSDRHVDTLCADLTQWDDCTRIADEVQQTVGNLDVLVNCVGTSDRGLASDLSAQRLRELIDQNVISTLHCCQVFESQLSASNGSVVNIGSLAGKVGARYLGGYNAAKHALAGLTQQIRLEWKEQGIHVALVSPGPIKRSDAGTRYRDQTGKGVPESASAPGGGTRVKGLAPERVAKAVLRCAKKERKDVILPGYLRFLIVLGNASPKLGDWLLLKFTSSSK